ncbi:AIG2-like family-domain-containing protein [Lasiosphaeris hirsuta]|uniref:Putative gamma-glutamylcyclotransferase n=1 Tax=Lasiosphaeris hirsuta TaxID=260670 RepID=A0AA40AQZ9_9PEZI|nr:AIG2-like family-domain-containing protein [Lasiosphaeris hirsuta]
MADKTSVQGDDGVHCAFFYGTLMIPDVFFSVCYGGRDVPDAIKDLHTFQPAVLHGYCRRRVRYADYPGMTPDKDHSVLGAFVTGLTRANIERLDFFEGGQYERRTISVNLLVKVGDLKGEGNVEGGEKKAMTYVFQQREDLEEREWDLEEFRREKLKKWTRAGYIFDECDPDDPAKVADE